MYNLTILLCLQYSYMITLNYIVFSFFLNTTATTEIYTLSLHDALPIFTVDPISASTQNPAGSVPSGPLSVAYGPDRKSTRLNSSHVEISYAVFCLKKKIKNKKHRDHDIAT